MLLFLHWKIRADVAQIAEVRGREREMKSEDKYTLERDMI